MAANFAERILETIVELEDYLLGLCPGFITKIYIMTKYNVIGLLFYHVFFKKAAIYISETLRNHNLKKKLSQCYRADFEVYAQVCTNGIFLNKENVIASLGPIYLFFWPPCISTCSSFSEN